MSIAISRLYDANNITRVAVGGISWALWTGPITAAPAESGSGLSTDINGAVTVPSTASSGILMLRRNDTDMGLYDI